MIEPSTGRDSCLIKSGENIVCKLDFRNSSVTLCEMKPKGNEARR